MARRGDCRSGPDSGFADDHDRTSRRNPFAICREKESLSGMLSLPGSTVLKTLASAGVRISILVSGSPRFDHIHEGFGLHAVQPPAGLCAFRRCEKFGVAACEIRIVGRP
jgi:hypothetical protein